MSKTDLVLTFIEVCQLINDDVGGTEEALEESDFEDHPNIYNFDYI